MANSLKMKGGLAAGLPILADREPGWTTDDFKLYVGQGGVSKLVGEASFLKLIGGAVTGPITLNADPTQALHAVTKQYTDALAGGVDVKDSVRVATAAALPVCVAAGIGVGKTLTASAVGVLTVDSFATVLNDRILVKNQVLGDDNGIYKVTTAGAAAVAFVLTRSTDADSDTEITAGMYCFVEEGTVNADTGFVLTTNNPIVIDTNALIFAQFSGAGQVVAGAGLTKTGTLLDVVGTAGRIVASADSIDIDPLYVGQTSMTTLGTISTGIWNATKIAATKGGTGQISYTVGDILQSDTINTLSKLPAVATGNVLISGGVGVLSSWGKVQLSTMVNGTLPATYGGTDSPFFGVTGPLQSRIYTFPDVNSTMLSDTMTIDGGTW